MDWQVQMYSVGHESQDSGKLMMQMKSQGCLLENPLLHMEAGLFVLLRPSTG